tara:strand:+ start:65512 stop:66387 length:876 start_codon:yes stop_codon:yes gene_type:complete
VESILVVEELTKTYRKGFIPKPVLALDRASFEVRKGSVTGFIGANGAGKTTTLRCLLNFTHADSGKFSFFGDQGFSMEARRRVGYLPEHPYFYGYLTGTEFLNFYSGLSGQKISQADIQNALKTVRLDFAADRPLSGYSKGMLQRVGLAQALIHRPDLLILDESMSGLDPDGRLLVRQILKEVSSKGVTLFFSTHLLDDAENLCEDLVLMAHGKVKYAGTLKGALPPTSVKYVVEYQTPEESVSQIQECETLQEFNELLKALVGRGVQILEARSVKPKLEDLFRKTNQESK